MPKFVPEFAAKRFLQSKKDWVEKTLQKIRLASLSLGEGKEVRVSKKQYKENKEEARKLVLEKLEYWKNFYKENFQINFVWKKVAIKNSKTRWGSCSSKKNLNFSYKIIFLSPDAQDYLIVHELSHLIHMNHSKNFWDLVSVGIPDWKAQRKFLKTKNLD